MTGSIDYFLFDNGIFAAFIQENSGWVVNNILCAEEGGYGGKEKEKMCPCTREKVRKCKNGMSYLAKLLFKRFILSFTAATSLPKRSSVANVIVLMTVSFHDNISYDYTDVSTHDPLVPKIIIAK